VLDELLGSLGEMRSIVDRGDVVALQDRLLVAQAARRALPTGAPPVENLAELRVAIPDQPGELAAITTLATELSVNVYDIEVAHSAGERGGRLILVVESHRAGDLADALRSRGRLVSVHELG